EPNEGNLAVTVCPHREQKQLFGQTVNGPINGPSWESKFVSAFQMKSFQIAPYAERDEGPQQVIDPSQRRCGVFFVPISHVLFISQIVEYLIRVKRQKCCSIPTRSEE